MLRYASFLLYTLKTGQYTIFLPANEARLFTNPELLAYWSQDRDSLMRTLTNHLVAGQISLDQLRKGGSYVSRTGQNAVLNARGHDDGVSYLQSLSPTILY